MDHNYFGMGKQQLKQKKEDEKENTFNPMSEALDCLSYGVDQIVKIAQERVTLIAGDLIEPLDLYITHHEQASSESFESARNLFHEFYEKDIKHTECKRLYQDLGMESEQQEIEIEKALLSH